MEEQASAKLNLYGLTVEQIAAIDLLTGEPRFRATQIARWLYRDRITSFEEMTNLTKPLRGRLSAACTIDRIAPTESRAAEDETATKYLFNLVDGRNVEAVWIRDSGRHTLCISSQAGCAYGCTFCATATMKAGRNLTSGEMLAQVDSLRAEMTKRRIDEVPNLVFMGMGEPLANYEELVQALHLICGEPGFGMAARRITISTVGLVPEIRRLAQEPLGIRLSFSLNATTDEVRSSLMPVNRKHPFRSVFGALRDYQQAKETPVTLEYVLLKGVNDTSADAKRLGQFARSLQCKVNLIAYNPHAFAPYKPLSDPEIEAFRAAMLPFAPRVTITVRWSRGRDIDAACGQLAVAPGPGNEEPASP